MKVKTKVFQTTNGHSYQITIPKTLFEALGYESGDYFEWEIREDGFRMRYVFDE